MLTSIEHLRRETVPPINDFRLGKWRSLVTGAVFSVMFLASVRSFSQSNSALHDFFAKNIGLSEEQIAAIKNGKAIVKAMPSRTPAEVFLFGAVYIHAAPEKYIHFAHDFDRLRQLPNYLALGVLPTPPQLSDLSGFSFDDDDIKALKECKPGNCLIQIPAGSMDQAQEAIDWSAADPSQQVNKLAQRAALELVRRYQRDGNQALGMLHDKRNPTDVPRQFAYMLSYAKALPEQLPDFHRYLLDYPDYRPSNTDDAFYWAKVKFGYGGDGWRAPVWRIQHERNGLEGGRPGLSAAVYPGQERGGKTCSPGISSSACEPSSLAESIAKRVKLASARRSASRVTRASALAEWARSRNIWSCGSRQVCGHDFFASTIWQSGR